MTGKDDRRARITVVEKAFSILEQFGPDAPELRISDVAASAGMNRSSAQRLVHTLLKCGWLKRDATGNLLALSHRVADPAFVYLSSNQLMELVMPFAVELNARTALCCDLWLRVDNSMITLAHIPSPASSLALAPVGATVSLTDSAVGRSLISALSRKHFDDVLADLGSPSPNADESLVEKLKAEREAGFSHDSDYGSRAGQVIAAAFRNADGEPIGAFSLSGFSDDAAARAASALMRNTIGIINGLRVGNAVRPTNIDPGSRVIRHLPDSESDALEIAAVSKALHLLQFFYPHKPLLTLTELSRCTGFPVPTVQRITDTLIGIGYLARDDKKRSFHMSTRSLGLMYRFQMSNDLVRSVWPRLIRFREECGLRCSFCVLDGTEIVHLLHVQSRPDPDYRTAHPGRRFLAVASSGGRAMLSWLPPEDVRRILDNSEIDPLTAQTTTDKELIFKEIREASMRGVAFADRQSVRDEVNVAAAVRGPDGRPLGAIVVSAPARTWTIDRLEKEVVPSLLSHSRSGTMY